MVDLTKTKIKTKKITNKSSKEKFEKKILETPFSTILYMVGISRRIGDKK
jgi:hypothetical protein